MKAFTYERADTPVEAVTAVRADTRRTVHRRRLGLEAIDDTPDGGVRISALVRNTDLTAGTRAPHALRR